MTRVNKKLWLKTVALILMLVGAGLILYPNLNRIYVEYKSKKNIEEVKKSRIKEDETDERTNADLLQNMREYNQEIFLNSQEGLNDAWSVRQPPLSLTEYGEVREVVGYVTIEAMDLQIPLYLGASDENLNRGAAVLGETSMPVGGENTNCVIAAHRGWKGTPMFLNIEKLSKGDRIIVDNLWETLEYQVSDISIIEPDDIEALKIQKGKDMVTLITCHPYPHNYQRYVVYCDRIKQAETDREGSGKSTDIQINGQQSISSQKKIESEKILNKIGIFVILLAIFGIFVYTICFTKRK